jgi:hypothetical protein
MPYVISINNICNWIAMKFENDTMHNLYFLKFTFLAASVEGFKVGFQVLLLTRHCFDKWQNWIPSHCVECKLWIVLKKLANYLNTQQNADYTNSRLTPMHLMKHWKFGFIVKTSSFHTHIRNQELHHNDLIYAQNLIQSN